MALRYGNYFRFLGQNLPITSTPDSNKMMMMNDDDDETIVHALCAFTPIDDANIVEHSNSRFESIRIDSFSKKSAFRFTSCHALFCLFIV